MAVLGKEYQAKVKNAANVLIGVAQVRVGLPSVRDAGAAQIGTIMPVTSSTVSAAGVVIPSTGSTVAASATGIAAGGDYTGDQDGGIIVRATGAGALDVYDAKGGKTTVDASTALTGEALPDGVTLSGDFTGAQDGDTWVIPVWSGEAQDKPQTQIVCPYSLFSGSTWSVGGLRSASFTPSLDDVKTLESGFPAEIDDRIVAKSSVSVKFESLEYTNDVMQSLKDMVSAVINEAKYAAVPVEVVMRTRGNTLVTFWVPNANLGATPDLAPTDDYSSMQWELGGAKMTQVSNPNNDAVLAAFNNWLEAQWIYRELTYVH